MKNTEEFGNTQQGFGNQSPKAGDRIINNIDDFRSPVSGLRKAKIVTLNIIL